ncbi:MAG: class I SAM-dependent RNA methyltransferase [Vampirovibrionia bacterium]
MVADIKDLKIDSMSFGLHAIATDPDSGIKVFIENACPGDELKAEIYDVQKDMAFANITEIISASPLREEDPRCKLHKICGSCQWQHIKYEEQLNFKRINLVDAFTLNKVKLASDDYEEENYDDDYEKESTENEARKQHQSISVKGLTNPWHFRNKVIYPVETVKSTGRLLAGYYKTKSNDLINIKHCPIQYSIFEELMEGIKELCSGEGIGTPLLRHVLLRSSYDENEVLVSFILRKKLFKARDRHAIKRIFDVILREFPEVKAATINYNDDSTNVILGEETELIAGDRDYIVDKLKDIEVKISTSSFFQINNEQFCNILESIKSFIEQSRSEHQGNAEIGVSPQGRVAKRTSSRLRRTNDRSVLQVHEDHEDDENAEIGVSLHAQQDLKESDTQGAVSRLKILDAYSGIGSISLSLAKAFPQHSFKSFELNNAAVINAKDNIELNNLNNLEVELASAEEYFKEEQNLDFDIIILNPPRKGCSNKILENISKSNAKWIIYLSCNPSTLARDIKFLEGANFKLEEIKAFDMFPHTFHLETLALLTKN